MALKLITPASTYPVSLAEAKLHLRVETAMTDDDTLITALITAATETAEQYTNRALMTQTWELTLDAFPSAFQLTRTPVQSITSLKYYDTSNVLQTLAAQHYSLDNADDHGPHYVVPAYLETWPNTSTNINAVALRYVSGYVTVPEPIKQWIKIMIGTMYEFREESLVEKGKLGTLGYVDRLLDRHKVWQL